MLLRKFLRYKRIDKLLEKYSFNERDTGDLCKLPDTDFFIISLPKCATSSLHYSILETGNNSFHGHSNQWLYRTISNGKILKQFGIGWEELIEYRLKKKSGQIFIFCGFREPVSRYFSLANELKLKFNSDLCEQISYKVNNLEPWSQMTPDEVFNILSKIMGIEVLNTVFDRERGFNVTVSGRITLLVYRIDAIRNVEQYIQEKILKKFILKPVRIAENEIYINFMRDLKLPMDELRILYNDKYVRYFYSDDEILHFKKKFSIN